MDFKAKIVDIGGKRVKLTIWDTAGQERFRTLTSCECAAAAGVSAPRYPPPPPLRAPHSAARVPTALTAAPSSSPPLLPPPPAYYRGAQGIIFVYDVARRETFESLADIWLREVDMYGTVEDAVKMVVANKTDLVRAWGGVGAVCGCLWLFF